MAKKPTKPIVKPQDGAGDPLPPDPTHPKPPKDPK